MSQGGLFTEDRRGMDSAARAPAPARTEEPRKIVTARCKGCGSVSTQTMAKAAWDAAAGGVGAPLPCACPSCGAKHLCVDKAVRVGIDAAIWATATPPST